MLTSLAASLAAVVVLTVLTTYAALVDLHSMRIPDGVNLAIFITGVIASFALGLIEPIMAIVAAVAGGGGLFAVRLIFRIVRGYDGLGLGDVKFVAASATWVGLEALPLALLVGCLAALGFVGTSRAWGDEPFDPRQPIPFGPFLGLGTTLVAGIQILTGMTMSDLTDALLTLAT